MDQRSIVIVGPTASGKSDCAIAIAQKNNGEVISSDSRQVYRGMDIGSGKEPGTMTLIPSHNTVTKHPYICDGIPHYMINIVHPNTSYNAGKFVKKAKRIREDIWKRNKVPIICGGTLFWAQALVENNTFTAVPPNPKLRKELIRKNTKDLLALLQTYDPRYAQIVDPHNPVRIIRAIEIARTLGSVPSPQKKLSEHDTLIIAISPHRDTLRKKIEIRLNTRMNMGMLEEVYALHHDHHVSWKRLESFGLEYKWCALYLQGTITKNTLHENLLRDIVRYAKRQETWIRRWEKQGAAISRVTQTQKSLSLCENFILDHHPAQ